MNDNLDDVVQRQRHIIDEQNKALIYWRRAYDDLVAQLLLIVHSKEAIEARVSALEAKFATSKSSGV